MSIDASKWYVIKPTGGGSFELHKSDEPKNSYAEAVQSAQTEGWSYKSVISGEELLSMGYDD